MNKAGFAYVEFERDEEAARAVEETNGTEIFGGFLEVEITAHKGNDLPPVKKYGKLKERVAESKAEQEAPPSSRYTLFCEQILYSS